MHTTSSNAGEYLRAGGGVVNARERSMAAHPAGKGIPRTPDRIQALIDAAQDEQAMDLANRELADAEMVAGGPLRRINEKHHKVSDRSGDWIDGITMLVLLVVVVLTPMLVAGWWPA